MQPILTPPPSQCVCPALFVPPQRGAEALHIYRWAEQYFPTSSYILAQIAMAQYSMRSTFACSPPPSRGCCRHSSPVLLRSQSNVPPLRPFYPSPSVCPCLILTWLIFAEFDEAYETFQAVRSADPYRLEQIDMCVPPSTPPVT